MFDLKKLNEIKVEDLKNVDYKALLENLKNQPDRIVLSVVIAATAIFLLFYFSKRPKKIQQLNIEIHTLEEKTKAIDSYEARKKEIKTFMDTIPKTITVDSLRKLLNDLAIKNNIYIDSFSQAQREDEDLYETISFQINISANEYRDVVRFVQDLESSPYGIRVDSWKGSLSAQRAISFAVRGKDQQAQGPRLYVLLDVAAVNFKDDKPKN